MAPSPDRRNDLGLTQCVDQGTVSGQLSGDTITVSAVNIQADAMSGTWSATRE